MSESQPKLRAEFELDSEGRPKKLESARLKHNHYKIRLYVDDAPPNAASITYKLHNTFRDPVREVFAEGTSGPEDFSETIATYGDFEIKSFASGSVGAKIATRELTEVLEDTFRESGVGDREAIEAAIAELKKY